jgi:asparagine synthase (glutamine-hydrolysing)
MIGGYIYQKSDQSIDTGLKELLKDSFQTITCGEHGFLFHDDSFSYKQITSYSSENLTLLTQDLLITKDDDGNFRQLHPDGEFAGWFSKENTGSFKKIVNNFRLIAVEKTPGKALLYLASHRAGNGRMFYYQSDSGIVFTSDIRFLFKIIPLKTNDLALYAILKYGAIPEPLTIAEGINAVPAGQYLRYDSQHLSSELQTYFYFDFPCDSEKFNESETDSYLQPARLTLRKSAEFLGKQQSTILISGGIDSSLYALYLKAFSQEQVQAINCTFGDNDPEFPFARDLARAINARFQVGKMRDEDALGILKDAVVLTGHPFSDFSSMPIVYILKFMKDHVENADILIEGNGGDDCFGFPDLNSRQKFTTKSLFPGTLKETIASLFKNFPDWKWESQNKLFSRIFALTDVHEISPINYFLVLTPVNFLGLNAFRSFDSELNTIMQNGFSSYVKKSEKLSYMAEITIRQLMHVNSRRWAAKAFSVGESLGIRVIYPYIWLDVLVAQGHIPWKVKIYNGIIKWPLKRLLEEYMPQDFIYRKKSGFIPPLVRWLTTRPFNHMVRDTLLSTNSNITRIVAPKILEELLTDALQGKNLRHSILNFLWGAFFAEQWIENHR